MKVDKNSLLKCPFCRSENIKSEKGVFREINFPCLSELLRYNIHNLEARMVKSIDHKNAII